MFQLKSNYQAAGDQPAAITNLLKGFQTGSDNQVLLGVTGSGKTFTMANVIAQLKRPTLVIAHNKTLAAQLYQEFRDYFPDNAVSYFVSYYDFYQPEAYLVSTDTYIEKEAEINEEIDKLRLAATANLLSRPDCIVIASVSCIYNLGRPEDFADLSFELVEGEVISRLTIQRRLTQMQYQRSTTDLSRGTWRQRGETIQLWPANEEWALNIVLPGDQITKLEKIYPLTGELWPIQAQPLTPFESTRHRITIYPAKHYIIEEDKTTAFAQIEADLQKQLVRLREQNKLLEAYRLEQRTLHDLDMLKEVGYVNGIENYSRYFDGRKPGDPPFSLINYLNYNAKKFGDGRWLTIVDESHMTIPQIRGMYHGDFSRKQTLVDYGFRLPAALDNRPLRFDEFISKIDQALFVSATPSEWEIDYSKKQVIEQIVRPTGLIDPPVEVRPTQKQIPDLINEIIIRQKRGQRTLVTTLTKKMAEVLTDYLNSQEKVNRLLKKHGYQPVETLPKAQYLHSDVETLERSDILDDLRLGAYDVVIGVNLLREGLDLPEVTLVAILDADQEGFLRSQQALIQTMGRAARHLDGHVIMYADKITKSMKAAMDEVARRRQIQQDFNRKHSINPTTIAKPVRKKLIQIERKTELPGVKSRSNNLDKSKSSKPTKHQTIVALNRKTSVVLEELEPNSLTPQDKQKLIKQLNRSMLNAAKEWNFELAAQIRDTVTKLENKYLI